MVAGPAGRRRRARGLGRAEGTGSGNEGAGRGAGDWDGDRRGLTGTREGVEGRGIPGIRIGNRAGSEVAAAAAADPDCVAMADAEAVLRPPYDVLRGRSRGRGRSAFAKPTPPPSPWPRPPPFAVLRPPSTSTVHRAHSAGADCSVNGERRTCSGERGAECGGRSPSAVHRSPCTITSHRTDCAGSAGSVKGDRRACSGERRAVSGPSRSPLTVHRARSPLAAQAVPAHPAQFAMRGTRIAG